MTAVPGGRQRAEKQKETGDQVAPSKACLSDLLPPKVPRTSENCHTSLEPKGQYMNLFGTFQLQSILPHKDKILEMNLAPVCLIVIRDL